MTRALLPPTPGPLAVELAWPISERARWLPALVAAIGIIYGPDGDTGEHDLPIFVAALHPV